jgi:tRNA threonylcarbamoyladenosine biosynthesis protein TsaE
VPSEPAHLTLRSARPGDTRAIARAVAAALRPGDVVSLSGELGAGKTVFVQGVAEEFGVTERVTSPTFVLVRTYPGGRLPIVHCDVYRLDTLHHVLDLGDDVLAPDVVTLIEWGDAIGPLLPEERLEVELTLADGPDPDRLVRLHACGRFADRLPAVAASCAPWRDGAR